jgi:hypothetical protein
MTGMTGPACREIRQLLGIHMVGATVDGAYSAMASSFSRTRANCFRGQATAPRGIDIVAAAGGVLRVDAEGMLTGGRGQTSAGKPGICASTASGKAA